ncbi:MAG: regulatory protein RecX [Bdellovibrionales bacterium]
MDQDNLRALNSITWYLARRDHSVHELRQKMRRRHSAEAIEWAIAEAKERRLLLDDQQLAQQWAKSLARKRRSQQYINGYLRRHKLPLVVLDKEDELAKCRSLLETKFGKSANFDREEQPKVVRFLRYRGFDGQTIKRVIYEKP